MTGIKRIVIYYRIPLGSPVSDAQVVNEINSTKESCRQNNWNPVHTFIDRGTSAAMYKTMTDYVANPQNNISGFFCFTIGDCAMKLGNNDTFSNPEEPMSINNKDRYKGGGIPYGYIVSSSGVLSLDRNRVTIVQEIFNSKSTGNSLQHIADALNQRRIPSPRGGEWSKQGISFILKNKAYVGEYTHDGKTHRIPCVISRQLFNKCQSV